MGLTRYGIKAIKAISESEFGSDNMAVFNPVYGWSAFLFEVSLQPNDLNPGDSGFSVDVRDGSNSSFNDAAVNVYFASIEGDTDDQFLVGSRFGFAAGLGDDIVEIHPFGYGPVALGPGDDRVVQKTGGSTSIIFGGSGDDFITDTSKTTVPPNTVASGRIGSYVRGDGFDDLVLIENRRDMKLVATSGAIAPAAGGEDTIVGNGGPDTLFGDGGDDLIQGGDGDDFIDGGSGVDDLQGGAGNDTLRANGDQPSQGDVMTGGSGEDLFVAAERAFFTITDWNNAEDRLNVSVWGPQLQNVTIRRGPDNSLEISSEQGEEFGVVTLLDTATFDVSRFDYSDPPPTPGTPNTPIPNGDPLARTGTAAPDHLEGDVGPDTLEGRGGGDLLVGRIGEDHLLGHGGPDRLAGGAGADLIHGGGGDDLIRGGAHHDRVGGGAGDDRARGGDGDDVLHGGAGDDRLAGQRGDDTLWGGAGDDRARGGDRDDVLRGGAGEDRLAGQQGDDTVGGGGAADTLSGGRGTDFLHGGSGEDLAYGGAGDDALFGQAGSDALRGGAGADTLMGGLGDDMLHGGAGDDSLVGNSGDDLFAFARGDGVDRIIDFDPSEDRMDFTAIDDLSFSDLSILGTGDDTRISYGDAGDRILLDAIDPAALTEENFLF